MTKTFAKSACFSLALALLALTGCANNIRQEAVTRLRADPALDSFITTKMVAITYQDANSVQAQATIQNNSNQFRRIKTQFAWLNKDGSEHQANSWVIFNIFPNETYTLDAVSPDAQTRDFLFKISPDADFDVDTFNRENNKQAEPLKKKTDIKFIDRKHAKKNTFVVKPKQSAPVTAEPATAEPAKPAPAATPAEPEIKIETIKAESAPVEVKPAK